MTVLIITVFLCAAALIGFSMWNAINSSSATYFTLAGALSLATLGASLASFNEEQQATDKVQAIADRLSLEVVKTEDDHFVATDADGKTVRCSLTQDELSVVCNDKVYQN